MRNACDHATSARLSRILALLRKALKTSEFVILRAGDAPSESHYTFVQKKFEYEAVVGATHGKARAIDVLHTGE